MSFVLNGTHEVSSWAGVVSSTSPSDVVLGVPSGLQNAQPRHRHVGQMPFASAASQEEAQLITSRSPGMPELQVAEHMWHPLHLQSLQ